MAHPVLGSILRERGGPEAVLGDVFVKV